ncbi:MAG TPA: hypothetical protein ENN65_09115 [Candidatus Hydrogenedentes bacterium]|nr:hypothetical protein [Candidatus Hydrogenedentota bacterium]
MSDLNTQLVREFFELNQFRVLTHWQHQKLPRVADPSTMLFIERMHPDTAEEIDFLLRAAQAPLIHRAVVEVRAWHADRFYPSVIESSPVLAHVAGEEVHALGLSVFDGADFTSILVISELPASLKRRARSLELLQEMGIGHVIEFPTILQAILERISAHGNYAPSQTLQTLRLLKRYNLIRRQQLEFSFPTEAMAADAQPFLESDAPDDADYDAEEEEE